MRRYENLLNQSKLLIYKIVVGVYIMQLDTGVVIALIGIVGSAISTSILAWSSRNKVSKEQAVKWENRLTILEANQANAVRLENRLTSIEHKVDPIWNVIIKELPKLLISPHTPVVDTLIRKAMHDIDSLTIDEIDTMIESIEVNHLKSDDTGKILASMFLLNILRDRKK